MEFKVEIFQVWKIMENDHGSGYFRYGHSCMEKSCNLNLTTYLEN